MARRFMFASAILVHCKCFTSAADYLLSLAIASAIAVIFRKSAAVRAVTLVAVAVVSAPYTPCTSPLQPSR